jgi:hypothetical protein
MVDDGYIIQTEITLGIAQVASSSDIRFVINIQNPVNSCNSTNQPPFACFSFCPLPPQNMVQVNITWLFISYIGPRVIGSLNIRTLLGTNCLGGEEGIVR